MPKAWSYSHLTLLPFTGSLSLGNTQVPSAVTASNGQALPDQLHDSTPNLPTCWDSAEYMLKVFPSREGKDQIFLHNFYSRNMCLHSWCEANLRPKVGSKPLVLWS